MHDEPGHAPAPLDEIDHTPTSPLGPGLSAGVSRLSPAAVRNQVFTVVRLREGYDLAEVDTFLGQVETTFTVLVQENAELYARVSAAERAARQARPAEERVTRIMAMAQDSADRMLAAAEQQAEAIVAQARDRAAALRKEVHASCGQELERRTEEFNTFAADYGDRLKRSLQAQADQLQSLLGELTNFSELVLISPPPPMAVGRQPTPRQPASQRTTSQQASPPGGDTSASMPAGDAVAEER
ncbi:DivIVA domain-containing protein [Streptosporangium sp. NBC_01469]|uniref:DivIVA domain-containing protein n=1 Tax=Streptosporangium sp. NBC_01469 TaxID=2903898 RepID=UPI002E2AD660|nr:DivIVA domain-containing protein [Streptosporangium sp. NBC_01469]